MKFHNISIEANYGWPEGNMVIIHYNYAAPEFGTPIPIWLTSEEEEKLW